MVAFEAGDVMETVGDVVSPVVANVKSPLLALLLSASVDRTLKWYNVPAARPLRVPWWLVTIVKLTAAVEP
jgi:hypothetical protein